MRLKQARDEAKRLRDDSAAYDEVWCLFDGNEHPHEDEARNQAQDNGIYLAVSCPSVELWVLLHSQERRGHITTKEALSLCHKLGLMSDKHILNPIQLYKSQYAAAKARSESLRRINERNGNSRCNPYTDIDLLVEAIRLAKENSLR
jgi:RloB-like protein